MWTFLFLCNLFITFSSVFLFTVFTSVNFFFRVSKDKYLIEPLLNGSNATRVFAFDNVCDLFWKFQNPFFNNFFIFDNVDCDVVIDKTKDIQIEVFNRAFYFDDILNAHFITFGIFDNRNGAVQLIKLQVMIDGHGFARFDVVEYETFVKCSNI